jgi:hypothetical protein
MNDFQDPVLLRFSLQHPVFFKKNIYFVTTLLEFCYNGFFKCFTTNKGLQRVFVRCTVTTIFEQSILRIMDYDRFSNYVRTWNRKKTMRGSKSYRGWRSY